MHPLLDAVETTLGAKLCTQGDASLLDTPRRMLLVSRADRNPRPDSPWLQAAVAATKKIASSGETLVTGIGRIAHDAALFEATRRDAPAIVVLEQPLNSKIETSELIPRRHLLISPSERIAAGAQPQRDMRAAWLSDRASAIYIRPGGIMSQVLQIFERRGIAVDQTHTVASDKRSVRKQSATIILSQGAQHELLRLLNGREWLTHVTREPDGAWPGETHLDYVRWLCSESPPTPRDAFAALCRILEEKRLRGSGKLIAGRTPMVSFSARSPAELFAQRRWRRGLIRWSFTPYALVIEKQCLLERARAVRYVDANELSAAPDEERCLLQKKSSSGMNWSIEEEWRADGDVDLSTLNARQMFALVAGEAEARQVQARFNIDAIALR